MHVPTVDEKYPGSEEKEKARYEPAESYAHTREHRTGPRSAQEARRQGPCRGCGTKRWVIVAARGDLGSRRLAQ